MARRPACARGTRWPASDHDARAPHRARPRARRRSAAIATTSTGESGGPFAMRSSRVWPSSSSITKNASSPSLPTSNTSTMLGCRTAAVRLASTMKRSNASPLWLRPRAASRRRRVRALDRSRGARRPFRRARSWPRGGSDWRAPAPDPSKGSGYALLAGTNTLARAIGTIGLDLRSIAHFRRGPCPARRMLDGAP